MRRGHATEGGSKHKWEAGAKTSEPDSGCSKLGCAVIGSVSDVLAANPATIMNSDPVEQYQEQLLALVRQDIAQADLEDALLLLSLCRCLTLTSLAPSLTLSRQGLLMRDLSTAHSSARSTLISKSLNTTLRGTFSTFGGTTVASYVASDSTCAVLRSTCRSRLLLPLTQTRPGTAYFPESAGTPPACLLARWRHDFTLQLHSNLVEW